MSFFYRKLCKKINTKQPEKLQQQPELAAALDRDETMSDLPEPPSSDEDEEMEGPHESAEGATGTGNNDTLTVEGLKGLFLRKIHLP